MDRVEDQLAGALLKVARGRAGLSQHAFADLIGIAQSTLSAYESGKRLPTLPTLLGMLSRAGFDQKLEVAEADDHDGVLAQWEATLDASARDRLRRRGYRLITDAA